MIVIKCARCKRKIIKYEKIGSGRVLRCFKARVSKYYTEPVNGNLVCKCGEMIGEDAGAWFQMRLDSFISKGTVKK
jgi:hypothetical protein